MKTELGSIDSDLENPQDQWNKFENKVNEELTNRLNNNSAIEKDATTMIGIEKHRKVSEDKERDTSV